MKRLGLSLAFAATLAVPAFAGTADLPTLADQMKLRAYRHTVDDMFAHDTSSEPGWFNDFLKTGNGVATTGKGITVGERHKDTNYELYAICKTVRCEGNVVYVLLEPGGGNAWGLSVEGGGETRYYNRPDTAQRRALQDAAESSSEP